MKAPFGARGRVTPCYTRSPVLVLAQTGFDARDRVTDG